MANVFGLDIGGANSKATYIKTIDGAVEEQRTVLEYFPIWKEGKEQLPQVLENLKQKVVDSTALDAVGVTITAELSDTYMTKNEGINHVLDCVIEAFAGVPTFVLNVESKMVTVEDARKDTLKVASANWAATGWMISQLIENCVVVDVGSTTTSIIPVKDGKVAAAGRTDLEKLGNGELIYSGSLRTNVATIVDVIPVKGKMTRVSSELFAQSGDMHLLLNNIEKKEYTTETCDGRRKTRRKAAARLARVVCADIDMLTEREILAIAQYIYDRQVEQIASGLKQVHERTERSLEEGKVVVTGLGRNFLARKAAEKLGFNQIVDIQELVGAGVAVVSPSVGVALMVATGLEGKTVKWKQS